MIMNTQLSNVDTNIEDEEVMGMEMNAQLYSVLSDKMYTNPIQSIIREILSNAIDANIAAGVQKPVQVHFANSVEPVFYIKDFGIGMTEEEIIKVFGTYGASNKRNDNSQIGGLGLGAKTPFAYKENGRMFTVESCKNGVKSTVVFYKNAKDLPCKKRLGTEPCDSDTGTKVSFSVAEKDFSSFIRESVPVFLFSMQMPEILGGVEKWLSAAGFNSLDDAMVVREYLKNTLDIPELSYYADKKDYEEAGVPYEFKAFNRNVSSQFSNNMVAEMGGVPYDIDLAQVFPDDIKTRDYVRRNRFKVLHFPIGSLDFQSSREKLNYTENTVSLLQRELINLTLNTYREKVSA